MRFAWWHDLRLAARALSRARGFSAAAILTLALGIAGTTGMFALIQGVLLRPLPVHDPDQLLVAWRELRTSGAGHWPFVATDIDAFGRSSRLLDSVAGVDYTGVTPTVSVEQGIATFVENLGVTGHFFDVLGVAPILGRALTPADDEAGAENVIVISHSLWARRYGAASDIIGRILPLQERPFRIIGVMPAGFEYPRGAEAWISIAALQAMTDPRFAAYVNVDLLARRKPQVTLAQAASELQAITAQLETKASDNAPRGSTAVVHTFADTVVGDVRTPLLVLFAAVSLVLLIAAANVANLLLMRGEARRTELAVRTALGATRGRLAWQLLAESLLLAVIAGAAGLALATWSLPPLLALVPGGVPRLDNVRIDAGVVAFALTVSALTAVLAGLAPLLSHGLAPHLRAGGRGTATPATRMGRRALVVAQVALAVTVVAAAGLLTRSLLRLEHVDLGLTADRLVFVQLALPGSRYTGNQPRHFQFLDDTIARLTATPGIAAATTINTRPFAGTEGWDAPQMTAEGQSAERAAANPSLNLEGIEPSYFATFDVPIVRGRAFTDRDRRAATLVAIVSDDVASRVWPGEDPIGKRVKFGSPTSRDPWRTIVGIARPTRYRELTRPRPTIYVPARQFETPGSTIVVRSNASVSVAAIAALARAQIHRVDPEVQVLSVEPFAQLLAKPLARPRFDAWLIGLFAGVALLLAAIGLYSVMAAYVRQRDAEIGIRVALGATAGDVRRLVLGEGLRLAGLGAVIGVVAAMITGRLLRGLLFEVQPIDPVALAGAALVLVVASGLACVMPTRRAVRIDPVTLLRAE